MSLLVIAFFLIAFVVAIMAVGVCFGRPPINGTCGGLNRLTGTHDCQFCDGDLNLCEADYNSSLENTRNADHECNTR